MSIAERPGGEAVCLHNVSWETYEALRDEVENRNVRMTYDQGWLQLMCPSKLHERLGVLLARLIEVWTEEAGIEVQNCRCVTLRRPEHQRGLEPDNCFYIEHEPDVRGRDELDLELDPPPDLAIEIDLTSSSLGRMSIYATIGVPEVWRWKDDAIEVHRLDRRGNYRRREGSLALPGFPFMEAERALARRRSLGDHGLVRSFRNAIRKARR